MATIRATSPLCTPSFRPHDDRTDDTPRPRTSSRPCQCSAPDSASHRLGGVRQGGYARGHQSRSDFLICARIIRRNGRSRTTRMRATYRWSPHRPRDVSGIVVLHPNPGCAVSRTGRSESFQVAHRTIRTEPDPARVWPLAPEATNTAAGSIASRPRGAEGIGVTGTDAVTQELRISRWSALPGLLLNTTALEPVWGSSPGPANRQDFNAVTVLMRMARRLFSGVGVNLGTGRPPMVTLAKAAPVNPGAFALGARVVSANDAAFQSAFPRGNGHTARCGVGESGCLRGTKGLHERAGATPIDGAARAAMGRCTSPSRAIA